MVKKLSEMSTMPQISAAFQGWASKISLVRIVQKIVNYLPVDSEVKYDFQGICQPLRPEQIALKPEGQRHWEWWMIHWYTSAQNLTVNDRIIYNGCKFKVMAAYDYSANNFIEYHIIKDFEAE